MSSTQQTQQNLVIEAGSQYIINDNILASK